MTGAGDHPDINRWNGVPRPFASDEATRLIEVRQQGWTEDTRATFAVCDRAGTPGGYLSIRFGWARGIAEVGYWLLASHRRRGLATDGVRVTRDWCFDQLGVTRLQAGIQPGNEASIAVVERLGFTREGLLRSWDTLNGDLHDEWMFSLLPSDARQ
jgi:RimJ/RimL family protein N-acetyltransferase